MTEPESDPDEFEKGDYVIGTWGPRERVLYRVTGTFEKETMSGRTNQMLNVNPALDHSTDDASSIPACEVRPAEGLEHDEEDTRFNVNSSTKNRWTSAGVDIIPPARADEFCPQCGSNAVRWAHDSEAGVGGSWCETCGYDREN